MKHFAAKCLKSTLCALLAALLIALSSMPALAVSGSSTLATSGSRYVVTASALNVRAGAGMSYMVIASAGRGREVTFLSEKNGWWRVRLGNGTTGYVDKQYLTPVSADETGAYYVKASALRMREKPTTSSRQVGLLNKGTKVYVSQLNGDWGYVSYGGVSGWVAIRYLTQSKVSGASEEKISVNGKYTVLATSLNVRSRASVRSTRIGRIAGGSTVRVSKLSGDWAYVSYTSGGRVKEGWVSTDYLG